MAIDKTHKIPNAPNLRFPEFSEDWEECKVGDYGKVITGRTPPTKDSANYEDGKYLWASPADLSDTKYISNTQTRLSALGFSKTCKLPKGSILATCIGSTIGKMGMASTEMSTNQQINAIVVSSNSDNHFVYYALQSRFPKYLMSVAVQAVPIMSKSTFEHLVNYTTCIEEQHKIGSLLNLIDERISTQIGAIEDYKKLKGYLIDELIEQRGRTMKIGDVIAQRTERNRKNDDYTVLSVNNQKGFIAQSEQFEEREVASEDKSNYKIVRRDDFAYNPARINVGSIARLSNYDCGIVSPMYICFHSDERVLPEFLGYFFESRYFATEVDKRLEGSVRLCLSYDGLCDISIQILNVENQQAIIQKLDAVSQKIALEEQCLDLFKQQKAYLLKNMFV